MPMLFHLTTQFLSGQQEADRLLANLVAFSREPAMGIVPTAARNVGIFSLLHDKSSRSSETSDQRAYCQSFCIAASILCFEILQSV